MAQTPRSGSASKRLPLIIGGVVGAVVIVACCGGFGVVAYLGSKMEKATRTELADADALWEADSKDAAATKYRKIIDDRRLTFVKESDRPRVYGRVIDIDMAGGNSDSAKKLLVAAIENNVEPAVNHPEARTALATVLRERQVNAEVRQFAWKQPSGWWGDALKSSDLRFSPMPSAEYAELVAALNSKRPEQVAKLLQHRDLHTLFTRDELTAMSTPYYGYHAFSRNVVKPGEDGYTEVRPKLSGDGKEKFQKPVFVVTGKAEDGVPGIVGGLVSGTCYRSFELKEGNRTKYLAKSVALDLEYSRNSDFKVTGIKGSRLAWINIEIPAIFNDEKCYGWKAMIVATKGRVEYIRFIEKRANAIDTMEMERLMPGGGRLAPTDSDLYRIGYETNDPARPYTIHDVVLGTTTKGQ